MISFTLENVLILTVFQLLLSGLILCGTLAVFYLKKDPFSRRVQGLVGAAFCFYSLHFLLRAVFAYHSLWPLHPSGLPPPWELLAEALEKAALVCLGFAYVPRWLPEKLGGRYLALAAAAVVLLVAGPRLADQHHWVRGAAALASAVFLAGLATLHLGRKGRRALFSAAPLVVLSAGQFLGAAFHVPGRPAWVWGAENLAMLVGLGLFALVVDARSSNLQVRFFLRLNLIFVAMAILLILAVAGTNAPVTHQVRLMFLILTGGVFVAAGLFGFTVRRANRTIREQYEELEKTNARLAHAARLASAGELAGGVAHEINNPAAIILTTSEFLLREAERQDLPEDFREDLQAIRRQARRISQIVSGLLTFSRPPLLKMQCTQINTVLRQSLALLAPRFRQRGVELEQRLAEDLPTIVADSDRLEQVFVNLLNNAVDALPRGGRVRVESAFVKPNGRSDLVVSIADDGVGIPPENLKSIFDPFFSSKPKGRGTGLGLTVSYGIIREHGGNIEVESRAGRGTVFHVHLPADGTRHEEL